MIEQVEMTYEQELLARGEERGEARGLLQAHRAILQRLLRSRFQALPEDLVQRINQAELPELQAALEQVVTMQTLDELRI